jgi:hypothetical protein
VLEPERTLPLSVIDVRTGDTVEITDHAIASFFWSPDGSRLLFLDAVPDAEQFWYRWGVWDGTSSFLTPRFVPSELIAVDYLQYFEQYAQSMSLWSPDSTAFAYPGDERGRRGGDLDPIRPGGSHGGPRSRRGLRGVVTRLRGAAGDVRDPFLDMGSGWASCPVRPPNVDVLRYIATR